MDYSKQLNRLKRERNLTQEDIARKAGVTQQTISNWINKRYPSLENIENLCNALGMEVWEFFIPKDDIAKYYKISPEALIAAQAIDRLKPEQKAAALGMINGFLDVLMIAPSRK